MSDELEYVRIKDDPTGNIYRVKGYTSNGDVLVVNVSGFYSMYRTTTVPIDQLEPIETDPHDAVGEAR